MTRHISYAEFRKNLAKYMHAASDGPILIKRDAGSFVLMSEEEFEGWKETLYLLRSPANAKDLLKAIEDADAGKFTEHGLIDE